MFEVSSLAQRAEPGTFGDRGGANPSGVARPGVWNNAFGSRPNQPAVLNNNAPFSRRIAPMSIPENLLNLINS